MGTFFQIHIAASLHAYSMASLCLGQIGERADLALPLVCGKTSTDNAL